MVTFKLLYECHEGAGLHRELGKECIPGSRISRCMIKSIIELIDSSSDNSLCLYRPEQPIQQIIEKNPAVSSRAVCAVIISAPLI